MAKDEIQKSELPEDAYALDASLYDDVLDAIEAQDPDRIAALFEPLHPACQNEFTKRLKKPCAH